MEESVYILFQKYLNNEINTEELKALYDYFAVENEDELLRLVHEHLNADANYVHFTDKKVADNIVNERWSTIAALTSGKKKKSWRPYATAAALLIGALVCTMYFFTRQESKTVQLSSIYGSDVLPGSNRATLLLAHGTRIELDSTSNGIQINNRTIKYNNGAVISANNAISSATLNVPHGGIYRLTLSDGTKVILNSGSSLTYPLQFDSLRLVKLEGEGYFEVSPNKFKPFKVQSGGQTLTVLGTHFNIQSYTGEPIQTTLLEGKVSLSSNGGTAFLAPGQQATIQNNKYQVKKVNAQEAISWANNLFVFNNMPLSQIFKSLERSYDVEITYPPTLSNERYLIEVPKNRKLSEILSSIADLTGVTFKIEGRRVTATTK